MLFAMSISLNSFASHVAGGNISYTCTANPNEFLVRITFYRDCSGIGAPGTINLIVTNDCGLTDPTAPETTLPQVAFTEVSQLCDAAIPNSTCNGGGLSGVQEYIYEGLITLPDICDAWHFAFQVCDRNPSTNLATNPCFYVESTLNSATQACNNSVTVNAQPIPYVCNNAPVSYDYGILEPDGDSVVFSLIGALQASADTIGYTTGFEGSEPIPGITIDPVTGQLNFTPTFVGNYVISVLIEEYNCEGLLVGTLIHDIQFFVEACVNTPPQAPVSITNFNNFGTTAVVENGNTIKLCTGDQFCFDAVFTDIDGGDILDLTSNINTFLPGATITQTGTNPATATVCWEFQSGYTGSIISVNASDQVCNVPGFATFVVDLDIPPALFPGTDSTVSICSSSGNIDFGDYIGFHQTDGQWYNPANQEIAAVQDPSTLSSGVYYHVVWPDTSAEACADAITCLDSDTAYVTMNIGLVNAFFDPNLFANESCIGMIDGTATVNGISGGAGPFDVVWTSPTGVFFTETVASGGTSTVNGLYGTGLANWNVTITDAIGCTWTHNFTVQSSLVTLNFNEGHPQCYGTSNGSISLTATGPIDPNTIFTITNSDGDVVNIPGTNNANNLPAGIYSVELTTSTGCEDEQFVELIEPPAIDVNFLLHHPECHGYTNGFALADTVLNYQGEYEEIFYGWDPNPNGSNGQNVTRNLGLGAGEYTLEIVDEVGCSNQFTFFITHPNPLVGVVEIPSLTYCRTRSFQKGNGEVTVTTAGLDSSGTGNVTYHWENLENGDESNNTTFIVNEPGWMEVTITDENQCTYIEQVYVDSLTPVADFDLVSAQFTGPGEYEGTEDIEVELINTSMYFSKPSYVLSDSTSKITWYNNEPGNENGNWFFRYDYNITKTDTVLRAVGDTETNYEVCLVAKNFNDCRDTACKILTVHPFPGIEVPNVFTPGATPNNEFFFPARGIGEFDCGVFNRYGVEVYHFNSINDKWDGTNAKNGKDCSDGVYFYNYNATSTNGTKFEGQGNVHLIRYKD